MKKNEVIFIKKGHSTFAIQLDTILYMEKECRKITIFVNEGENLSFYGKYDSVMTMLDERFVHPHESYVFNMQHIFRLGNQEVVMIGGKTIKMGGRCFGRLKKAYDEYIKENIRSRIAT